MYSSKLECNDNLAILKLTTHFGKSLEIHCKKETNQCFRLSFTGVAETLVAKGQVTKVDRTAVFLVSGKREFNGIRLNDEIFEIGDEAYAYDYYHLSMEHQPPGILITHLKINEPRLLFVNVDCLDGGGNLIKRYRCSPFTGSYLILSYLENK